MRTTRLPLSFLLVLFCFLTSFSGCRTGGIQQQAKQPGELRFIVLGDWGMGRLSQQRAVANQMAKTAQQQPVDFIISTGDNFYNDGVKSTDDPLWRLRYETVYDQKQLQVPWYVVLGNHDYRGNVQAQLEYAKKNPRWNLPALYYTKEFRLNDSVEALFVFLDTNQLEQPAPQHSQQQLLWLDSVLQVSDAAWKFVVGHHAVYTAGSRHGQTAVFIQSLEPIFKRHAINAYFCGHEHDLQHLQAQGLDYIVSGGGAEARAVSTSPETKFALASTGFALVTLTPDYLELIFINAQGQQVYSYRKPLKN